MPKNVLTRSDFEFEAQLFVGWISSNSFYAMHSGHLCL